MLGRRSRGSAWQDPISAISFLVQTYVIGESAQKIELTFDPAEELVGRGEDFEVAEGDCGWDGGGEISIKKYEQRRA